MYESTPLFLVASGGEFGERFGSRYIYQVASETRCPPLPQIEIDDRKNLFSGLFLRAFLVSGAKPFLRSERAAELRVDPR